MVGSLSGCAMDSSTDDDKMKEKITEEIRYLDTQIASIIYKIVGLNLQGSVVISKELEKESEKEKEQATSGNNQSEKQTQSSSDTGSSKEKESSDMISFIEPDGVLMRSDKVDWTTAKTTIENMYISWDTILLDLYQMEMKQEDILKFGEILDRATLSIKDEKKQESLQALAELYDYLPKYLGVIENQDYTDVYFAKSHLFHAISLAEQQKWEDAGKRVVNAQNQIGGMLERNTNSSKSYNMNRAYVQLKELEKSTTEKQLDIFYIRYKNVTEEIGLL